MKELRRTFEFTSVQRPCNPNNRTDSLSNAGVRSSTTQESHVFASTSFMYTMNDKNRHTSSTTSLSVVSPSPVSAGGIALAMTEGTTGSDQKASQKSDPNHQSQVVDFVGSSAAVKDLFSLPYTSDDRSLSVAIHNVEGTLVFDRDPQPDQGRNEQPTKIMFSNENEKQTRPLPGNKAKEEEEKGGTNDVGQSLVALSALDQLTTTMKATCGGSGNGTTASDALTVVNSFIAEVERLNPTGSNQPSVESHVDNVAQHNQQHHLESDQRKSALGLPRPDDYVHQYIPPTPEPREYLSWKFHDMNLLVGSDAIILRGKDDESGDNKDVSLTVRVEDSHEMQALVRNHDWAVQTGAFRPDHQRSFMQQSGKPSYAAAALKNTARRHIKPLVEGEKDTSEEANNGTPTSQKADGFSAPDLDEVKLQTCIVPSSSISACGLYAARSTNASSINQTEQPTPDSRPTVVSPVSTVLDAYLDNIMANVPQLALCLREKGFIQSVKLLETESIPGAFLNPSTMDTSRPFSVVTDEAEKVFSPQVMEMNAAAILKFLKLNCNQDNRTYLLRREFGQTSINLYDISSISEIKQKKWIWWLAMMSCRFAHRLRNISVYTQDMSKRRCFRRRERGLLQNALDLLEVLTDMDGSRHESLAAGVRESLADTFLRGDEDSSTTIVPKDPNSPNHDHTTAAPAPATSVSSSQHPYATLTVDALNKAHDHLSLAIKCLFPHLEAKAASLTEKPDEAPPFRVSSIDGNSSDDSDEDCENSPDSNNDLEVIASATQLFGLHEKIINVSLRLAEIHLRNYYSSSAMQTLRTAARRIADSLVILSVLSSVDNNKDRDRDWLRHVLMQYVWLWEHCGHFARSFAGDELWRDRGHAAADDILVVLQDAESAFSDQNHFKLKGSSINMGILTESNPLSARTENSVNLHSLSGVVQAKGLLTSKQHPRSCDAGFDEAREAMKRQKFLIREERKVIVAACLAYERAVHTFKQLAKTTDSIAVDRTFLSLLQQRLGDACNEAGKILLDELRTRLSRRKDESSLDDAAAHALLTSAEFWFLEGLTAFEESSDLRNLVLLRCNLCQCYKLRANALFSDGASSSKQSVHAEGCLQEAANQLESAHEALGDRTTESMLWDMVSAELAATFLVLGVRRRQSLIGSGNTPVISQALRLSPGQERSIVEPMERALKIYQSSGNLHQSAAAHYQLALFFSKVWTCQRDETKTRQKLAAAFTHYSAAHSFFSLSVKGNELTLCLVCLDLSNLYSSVQGEEGNAKALFCCLDTMNALCGLAREEPKTLSRTNDWFDQMDTVASSVEDRVFKLLRSLVKLFDDGETKIPYKGIYRASLSAKMMTPKPASSGQQLVLDRLSNVYGILKATDEALRELGLK